MDTDTAEIVRWLRGRALLEEAGLTKNVLAKAADTIERLQKESIQSNVQLRSELTGAHDAMDALVKALTKTEQERDAALAEVDEFKHRLTAAPRCQLCGERVEPPRSFCSICCAR